MHSLSRSRNCVAALLLAVSATLSGCGTRVIADRETNPVIEDYLSTNWFSTPDAGVLATTASRRTVLMRFSGDQVGAICAEPPPDVGEAIAKLLLAELAADVGTPGGTTVGASGAFDKRLATAITALLKRSQGLQLLRDQNYDLCVDRMNGWVSPAEYNAWKRENIRIARDLIMAEIPTLAIGFDPGGASVPQSETDDSGS